MTNRTKALQFSTATKKKIHERDEACIFCKIWYHMNLYNSTSLDYQMRDAMHIINKSQGGLGIEQNGVEGCRYHHSLLDNGNKNLRAEMLQIIEEYMKDLYTGWNKEDLYYKKYQ